MMMRMTVAQKIGGQDRIVEQGLENDIHVTGLAQVIQAPGACFRTEASAGVASDVQLVGRALAEPTFLGN